MTTTTKAVIVSRQGFNILMGGEKVDGFYWTKDVRFHNLSGKVGSDYGGPHHTAEEAKLAAKTLGMDAELSHILRNK